MKDAWIVILKTTGGSVPFYYYGPFWEYGKVEKFVEKECVGFETRIEKLVTVER